VVTSELCPGRHVASIHDRDNRRAKPKELVSVVVE